MNKKFKSFNKENRFEELCKAVNHCKLCQRLRRRKRVLSNENGNIYSKILFVAEAPGRLGADKTGIPLYGDKTGDNFQKLLGNIGWSRKDIFITNAILCNPREEKGNNDTPTSQEIKNCSPYLQMIIELVQPDVVVSLGKIALNALKLIAPLKLELKEDIGRKIPWLERVLVPLYHPGPRAIVHRSLANQRRDFMELSKFVHPIKGIKEEERKYSHDRYQYKLFTQIEPTPLQQLTTEIINALGKISYFKLTKLLYLVDLIAIKRLGRSITGEIYIRQPEGPWPPKLEKDISELNNMEVILSYYKRMTTVEPGPSHRFCSNFDEESLEIIFDVISKYGEYDNFKLKTATYLTEPMKYILKQENLGRDMRRKALIYKDKILSQLNIK